MADSESAPTARGEQVFSRAFGTIVLVFALAVASSTGVLVLIDNNSDLPGGCDGGSYGTYCPPPATTTTTGKAPATTTTTGKAPTTTTTTGKAPVTRTTTGGAAQGQASTPSGPTAVAVGPRTTG